MENRKKVLALGFFDGVHLGHAALLKKTLERAKAYNLSPGAVSFDVPPVKSFNGETIELINSPVDRADVMRRVYGIDDLIFLHFDDNLRMMEWDKFIEWLKSDFGAAYLIAGYDFRFGYMGRGNAEKLSEKCRELNLGCDIIDRVTFEGETVSSTRIRELLYEGNIERANQFLGHRHFLNDTVKYGYKVGRKLGTPTINMTFEPGVLSPRFGVYAAEAHVLSTGQCFEAATNVGIKPTVTGDNKVTVESFLLGYSGNLYGQRIRVEFYKFLRPEMKFSSLEALSSQIHSDAIETHEYLSSLPCSIFKNREFNPPW